MAQIQTKVVYSLLSFVASPTTAVQKTEMKILLPTHGAPQKLMSQAKIMNTSCLKIYKQSSFAQLDLNFGAKEHITNTLHEALITPLVY